jgi:hypothetical protein
MKGVLLISILLFSGCGAPTDAPRKMSLPARAAETNATVQDILPILHKLADDCRGEVRRESVRDDRVSWHVVFPSVGAFVNFWKKAGTNLTSHGWTEYKGCTDYILTTELKYNLEFRKNK